MIKLYLLHYTWLHLIMGLFCDYIVCYFKEVKEEGNLEKKYVENTNFYIILEQPQIQGR